MNGMKIVWAAVLGFLIDLVLGDPAWLTHPVIIMGRWITKLEKTLRKLFPATDRGLLFAGAVLALVLAGGTLLFSALILKLAGLLHPVLCFTIETLWSWQVLAMTDLKKESENVRRALTQGTIDEARTAVARIVGRDTQLLTAEGVTKAAVETVAENFSDGEIAPLFWLLVGGAPLALTYKAINTMDSMVGYKNDRYLFFGRVPAKLDDVANWIPARLSALLLIAAAFLCGEDAKNAAKIWCRDRYRHASPNSGQTEAAMAGALGLQLLGPASYFGKMVNKPTIGDAHRPAVPDDIRRANRMMMCGSMLGLVIFCLVRCMLCAALGT